jgi:hypothetical protein
MSVRRGNLTFRCFFSDEGVYSNRHHWGEFVMKIRAVVEYDAETQGYAVYCPELPGCASAGDTEEDALETIREAILLYLKP